MLRKLLSGTTKVEVEKGPSAPPGQYITDKFPVMSLAGTPKIDMVAWQFKMSGLVEEEVILNWRKFTSLPEATIESEFHCVTQWSRLENTWDGVAFTEVIKLVKPKPEAKFVMFHCYGGYTTNVGLDVLNNDDVIFAYAHNGKPLHQDHGGPLRVVVPKLYGWKSAKWVNGMEFMEEDRPGFWEVRGYHMEADPLKEQRFGSPS